MVAPLRLVRSRPSLIEPSGSETPRPPWTMQEILAMHDTPGPVPHRVITGMYVAAWARAEGCPLNIVAGRLEPHCRIEPTEALYAGVARTMGEIVGCLFWAIPLLYDHNTRRPFAASWRVTGFWTGEWGAN